MTIWHIQYFANVRQTNWIESLERRNKRRIMRFEYVHFVFAPCFALCSFKFSYVRDFWNVVRKFSISRLEFHFLGVCDYFWNAFRFAFDFEDWIVLGFECGHVCVCFVLEFKNNDMLYCGWCEFKLLTKMF